MTTKTIGATGDYSTINSWEAAAPAGTLTQNWVGDLQNQDFFGGDGSGAAITLSGNTTSSSASKWLQSAGGASFDQNANKLTNQLKYNASNGCAIHSTAGYQHTVTLGEDWDLIGPGIQVTRSGSGTAYAIYSGNANCQVLRSIAENTSGTTPSVPVALLGASKAINSLFITALSINDGARCDAGGSYYNCTFVKTGTFADGNGLKRINPSGTAPLIKNCAIFGFNAVQGSNALSSSSSYNATDKASCPGTNNQTSKTYTSQFVDTTNTSARDYRVKAGSDLVNGTRDQTNTSDLDIVGQARSTTTPTIGCWEYVAAGSVASSAGTGAASSTGVRAGVGVGASAGSGPASAIGVDAGIASSVGAGAAAAIGVSNVAEGFASTGAAVAAAVGTAIVAQPFSSAGAAVAAAEGASAVVGTASSAGAAAVDGIAQELFSEEADSAGAAIVLGFAASLAAGDGSASGAAIATGIGAALSEADGAAAGAGDGAGASGTTATADGASAGQAAVAGIGAALSDAIAAADGVGTASGITGEQDQGEADSYGAAVALAIGGALAVGDGIAAGQGTAQGAGSALAAADAASTGSGAAYGLGTSLADGVAQALGTAAAVGAGGARADADGASAGTGQAAGTGTGAQQSVGASDGVGAATGVGEGAGGAVGESSGSGTATAIGAAIADAVGDSAGTAVASFLAAQNEGTAATDGFGAAVATGLAARTIAPSEDVVVGTWLREPPGLPLVDAVNEEIPDPSDFIYAPATGTATCRLRFPPAPVPIDRSQHRIAYAIEARTPGQTLTVRLYSGATLLGEWTHTDETGIFEQAFDGTQVTDYGDLELELIAA